MFRANLGRPPECCGRVADDVTSEEPDKNKERDIGQPKGLKSCASSPHRGFVGIFVIDKNEQCNIQSAKG